VKTQLTTAVRRDPHQLCTAERSPQALLPKVPPGVQAKVEGAFRKLCEALSMAEGTSEALGGWAHRDPDRLQRRRTSIRQLRKGLKRSVK
jgi:hypothetical protein